MVNKTKQEKEHNCDYTEEAVKQTTTVKLNQLHCEICKTVDQREVLVSEWRMITEQLQALTFLLTYFQVVKHTQIFILIKTTELIIFNCVTFTTHLCLPKL